MIDVRDAFGTMKVRAEEEAYWRALDKLFGPVSARTLRATLRQMVRDEGMSERDRVAKGLRDLLSLQADAVEAFARREPLLTRPPNRSRAIAGLEVHDHWADFTDETNEASRAMPFVSRGLARGAKVIALLPTDDRDRYRRAFVGAGHRSDLDRNRIAFRDVDGYLEAILRGGSVDPMFQDLRGLTETAVSEEYPEVWFIDKIAPRFVAPLGPSSDLATRVERGWVPLLRELPISLYCPYPDTLPLEGDEALGILAEHRWMSVADETWGRVVRES